MRIAGLLHMAEHGKAGLRHPITSDTFAVALRIGEYSRAHAARAFDDMGRDQATRDALYLLDVLRRFEVDEVSVRNLYRAAKWRTVDERKVVIDRLAEHGYVVRLASQAGGPKGGRPFSRLAIHPEIRSQVPEVPNSRHEPSESSSGTLAPGTEVQPSEWTPTRTDQTRAPVPAMTRTSSPTWSRSCGVSSPSSLSRSAAA